MPAGGNGGGNRDAGDGGSDDGTPMHVVMLPWLAFGHIVPFVQLARRLLASTAAHIRVTFLTAAGNVPRVEAMLSSSADGFTYVYTSFGDGQPSAYDRMAATMRTCDGMVLKTCAEMEGAYIDYLAGKLRKPLLVAGPLVPPDPPREETLDDRWATWLAAFADGSVVFASFGSETFLPPAAAAELLLGLEATGRPFVAVLNSPDGADGGVVLPPGFEERVSGRGLVHAGWVQQQHILRYRSVGCYVTHAGLSSVVEGLVAGCRLVLLPIKGDQYLNAALFARELRVGVEVARRDEDGWFGRQDVSDPVAAAVADGGEGDARKWAEFLTDDAVQRRFADEFVWQLRDLVTPAARRQVD